MMRYSNWLLVLAAAGGLLMMGQGVAAPYAPEVGKPHPEFTLPQIDTREPVSLAQFRGKKVLLIQFASW